MKNTIKNTTAHATRFTTEEIREIQLALTDKMLNLNHTIKIGKGKETDVADIEMLSQVVEKCLEINTPTMVK
jgi:hypothetical protein